MHTTGRIANPPEAGLLFQMEPDWQLCALPLLLSWWVTVRVAFGSFAYTCVLLALGVIILVRVAA